jgi:hypothetical protein
MTEHRILALQCLGDIEGPRFLDGRTGDGTVGLAPDINGFSGTRWQSARTSEGIITLKCLGDIDGPRYLYGTAGNGTVGLSPEAFFSGATWDYGRSSDAPSILNPFPDTEKFYFRCLDGDSFYLDGRTREGTVGLTTDLGLSGTKWRLIFLDEPTS